MIISPQLLRYGSLVLLVVQNCSAVLLMRYTQQGSSSSSSSSSSTREKFSVPIANLTIEVVKFLVCVVVVLLSPDEMKIVHQQHPSATNSTTTANESLTNNTNEITNNIVGNANIVAVEKETLLKGGGGGGDESKENRYNSDWFRYSLSTLSTIIFSRASLQMVIPAALFTLQNNLLFVALANLEAAVFQVIYQLKLFCTAILMAMLLGKELNAIKWFSLLLLFCGIVLTQLKKSPFSSSSSSSSKSSGGPSDEDDSFYAGIFAVVVCATSSAVASVYFEKVLKSQSSSLFVKNIQLAVYSFLFNWTVFMVSSKNQSTNSGTTTTKSIFAGFDLAVWILVLVQAAGGLLVAVVIKYCDNILKSFATSIAIIANGVVSYLWMDFQPSGMFVSGAMLVILATFVYSI